MIQLGIFSNVFERPSIEGKFDAVAAHGLQNVQLNMSCAGLPSMPDRIEPAVAAHIRRAAQTRGVAIASLSGTFNMIHPDPVVRRTGIAQLGVLAGACGELGTRVITLCTGTRNAENMWRHHPENDSPAAWSDLLESMAAALQITEGYDLLLAFEPEPGNVITTPARGRALLDAMQSPRLGVVMDPANLWESAEPAQLPPLLEEAFAQLGDRIFLAHAKDRSADGVVQPAGKGIVPWPLFIDLLNQAGFDGALVLHGLDESQVAESAALLRREL
jgi:sugar phosphate isomerase/epimerase